MTGETAKVDNAFAQIEMASPTAQETADDMEERTTGKAWLSVFVGNFVRSAHIELTERSSSP